MCLKVIWTGMVTMVAFLLIEGRFHSPTGSACGHPYLTQEPGSTAPRVHLRKPRVKPGNACGTSQLEPRSNMANTVPDGRTAEPDDDGRALAARLQAPTATSGRPPPIRVIETHISRVFLTGAGPTKVKKPLRLPFPRLRNARTPPHMLRAGTAPEPPHRARLVRTSSPLRVRSRRRASEGARPAHRVRGADAAVRPGGGTRRAGRGRPRHAGTTNWRRSAPTSRGFPPRPPYAWPGPTTQRRSRECCAIISGRAGRGWRSGIEVAARALRRRLEAETPGCARRSRPGAEGRVRECHGDLHCGNVVRWRGRLVPRSTASSSTRHCAGST